MGKMDMFGGRGRVCVSAVYGLQHTECLVVNFAFLFNCATVGQTSDSMTVPT